MRVTARAAVLGIVVGTLAGAPLSSQEKLTERTLKLGKGTPPAATLAAMEWLVGRWVGTALGGDVEEIWSAPQGGAMMGMYRLVRDGEPVFYELLTLVEQNGSLLMRLKHFHPHLAGWEEKDDTVDFPLVALGDGAVHFEGMSFHPQGETLTVYLAIGSKDGGAVREETFTYRRAPLGER